MLLAGFTTLLSWHEGQASRRSEVYGWLQCTFELCWGIHVVAGLYGVDAFGRLLGQGAEFRICS